MSAFGAPSFSAIPPSTSGFLLHNRDPRGRNSGAPQANIADRPSLPRSRGCTGIPRRGLLEADAVVNWEYTPVMLLPVSVIVL